MGTKSDKDKIARSPTPPETEDEGDDVEWPVHGIVGEDVDVFGVSSYEVRWKNWNRADGTNTTWQRDFEGDPALVNSWNDAMKHQRLQKAAESQSIDLKLLASTPIHDRLTFERAQAVEEKMAERSRRDGGCAGKSYQGWMAEIDRQVAHHERSGGGEKQSQSSSSSQVASATVPKKRGRQSSLDRGGPHAESSRSTVSRSRRVSRAQDKVTTQPPPDGGDTDTIDSEL